jgi:hypothetical protein
MKKLVPARLLVPALFLLLLSSCAPRKLVLPKNDSGGDRLDRLEYRQPEKDAFEILRDVRGNQTEE